MMITNLFKLLYHRYSIVQQYLEGYWMLWWRATTPPGDGKLINPYQQRVLSIIQGSLPSFRQEGNRFYEESPDLLKIVEAEFVNIGYGERSVTIYFGVHVPEVHKLVGREKILEPIGVGDCVFLCNINEVAQGFNGRPARRYWTLGGYSRQAYRQIKQIMAGTVFPFAQKVNSLASFNAFIDSIHHTSKEFPRYPVQLLLLKYLAKKDDEVKKITRELLKRDPIYFGPCISGINKNLAKHGLRPITKD
ncbi:MAG: hypothetical protein HC859_11490 [Bacteroidia bacterium]|nr:hypothetical protein [Bacteroidia bacterium]